MCKYIIVFPLSRTDHHSVMKRTHSALFMGAYAVLYLHWSADYILQKIKQHIGENLSNFCDHKGSYDYKLSIYDCFECIKVGVVKHGWFTLDATNSLKSGLNMNWVVPNKLIAMKDPKLINSEGQTRINSKYLKELLKNKIDYVVRLNGKDFEQDSKYGKPYPLEAFFAEGIVVCDIPMKDGGTPTQKQLEMFLEICSIPESQMAVHCHAGMGRTGTMIACCLIRDYEFTARQAVAWLNLCRRGSVMGKQHDFLDEYFEVISKKNTEDSAENTTCANDELKKVDSVMQEEKVNRNAEEEMEPKIKKGRLDKSAGASEQEQS